MKRSMVTVLAAFATLLLLAPMAFVWGFEQTIPAKRMLLKFSGEPPVGKGFKLDMKDTIGSLLLMPTRDPVETGGNVTVSAGGADGVVCTLAAQNFDGTEGWTGLGDPPGAGGYQYLNKAAPLGTARQCNLFMVTHRGVKLGTRGTGDLPVPLAGGNPDMQVVVTLGRDMYRALCSGPHQRELAGRLVKSANCSLVANGDGTVLDTAAGLAWETKDHGGGLHDASAQYAWAGTCSDKALCQPNAEAAAACAAQHDGADLLAVGCNTCASGPCTVAGGATIWDFRVQLNREGGGGFANRDNWRLPAVAELERLTDGSQPAAPYIADEFNNAACAPACAVPYCSCSADSYWSGTTVEGEPGMAWVMDFASSASLANAPEAGRDAFRRKKKAGKKKKSKPNFSGGLGVGPQPIPSGCLRTFVGGAATVYDECTELEWEKKNAANGQSDYSNLHDADNTYVWAGCCGSGGTCFGSEPFLTTRCQPNAAAEAACRAQTAPEFWAAEGCNQCSSGICYERFSRAGPLARTVWDWVAQVNVANFDGHGDWRLPTSADCGSLGAQELESILDVDFSPVMIDPIFGPTSAAKYWSATIAATAPRFPVYVNFTNGNNACSDGVSERSPLNSYYVRTVR